MFYKILASIVPGVVAIPVAIAFTKGTALIAGKRKKGQRGRVKSEKVEVYGPSIQILCFAFTLLFKGKPVAPKIVKHRKAKKVVAKKVYKPRVQKTVVVNKPEPVTTPPAIGADTPASETVTTTS